MYYGDNVSEAELLISTLMHHENFLSILSCALIFDAQYIFYKTNFKSEQHSPTGPHIVVKLRKEHDLQTAANNQLINKINEKN